MRTTLTASAFAILLVLVPAASALDLTGPSTESPAAQETIDGASPPALRQIASTDPGLARFPLLPPTLVAWMSPVPQGQPPMQVHGQASLPALTFFTPLGDIDLDGHADVLVETFDPIAKTTSYVVLAGPDLTQRLWSLPAEAGRVLQTAADVTGDGVLDPVAITSVFERVVADSQGAAGAGVEEVRATGEFALEALNGQTGSIRFDEKVGIALDATTAAAGTATGQVGPQVTRLTQTAGGAITTGTGAARTLVHTVEMTRGAIPLPLEPPALPLPLPLSATNLEVDVVIDILDAAGSVTGSIVLTGANINPVAVAAPDLDLDGVADTVVLIANKTSPVEEASVVVPIVTSYLGQAGDLAWSTALDQIQGVPMLIPDVGDLDADGVVDMAVLGLQAAGAATQDPLAAGSVLSVISGASGHVMGTVQAVGSVTSAVPFGQLAQAEGEVLLLLEHGAEALDIAAAGADLQAIWSLSLDPSAVPLNEIVDQSTNELKGFADWTGDTVADVAVAVDGVGDEVEVALYSGVDGALAWSKTLTGAVTVVPVPDLAGPAGTALAVVQTLPDSGDTILSVVRAADGEVVWNATFETVDGAQELADTVTLEGDVEALGDLDGDEVEDFAVRLEMSNEEEPEASAEIHGDNVSVSDETVVQTFVVSGRTGAQLHNATDANVTSEAAASIPQLELGDVEPGPAYLDSAEVDEGRDSPGIPMVALGAALVVIAVLVRRRSE